MNLEARTTWLESAGIDWCQSENLEELKGWLAWLEARKPEGLLEIGTRTGSGLYLMAGALVQGGTAHGIDKDKDSQEQRAKIEHRLREEGIASELLGQADSSMLGVGPEYDCVFLGNSGSYPEALADWKSAMLLVKPGGCVGFRNTNLWQGAGRFLGDGRGEWKGTGAGIGAFGFRDRLLFIVNGGLGDAAEMTRVLLVASKLGYIVHVLVISGMAGEMGGFWAKIPWVTQVTKEQAMKLHYRAVLCPTRSDVLEQRAAGLSYDLLSNGGQSVTGAIIEDWQNLLVAVGESREKVVELMPKSPLAFLLPSVNKDLVIVAPGVGSALKEIEAGKPDKRYGRWDEVVGYLPRPLAFVGNEKAREPWMEKFKDDRDVLNLIGQTPHAVDLLPLFARATAVFAPDNGIGHLAGLFGVPTISVFNGVTSPKKFAPPEATVLEGTNETLKPGIIAAQMHYIINPECREPVNPVTGGLLSVIITTHNEGDEVLLTCQDVYERAGCPVEIIVVDEGSTDGSCDHLPGYVKVLHNKERTGVAPARNQGVREATGEAFMFLDAHMRVLPGAPAKMMLAALEKQALIVSGVAPLYNPSRGANWTCKWHFRNGRLRSKWHSGCRQDFEPTDCFVAPGWVVSRREWEKIGPWPSSLSGWGSTEVCKGLQAFTAGVPMLAMKSAVTWHRFRGRFPYKVSPAGIQNNAHVVARIIFGEKLYNEVFLPLMKPHGWSEYIEKLLQGDSMKDDVEATETRRKVAPEEFLAKYFPGGLKDEAAVGEKDGEQNPGDGPIEKIDWYQTDHCQSLRNCVVCRTDKEFRRVVSILFKTPSLDFACPRNMGEDGKPKPQPEKTGEKVSFFETPHCTSKAHCFACRNNREFRESIAQNFAVPSIDFDCPQGITKENLVKPSFFENDTCKSRQNCKACRTDKNFRTAVAQRFDVPDAEFKCPLGLVEDNFKDGKFPSIIQEAMNLVTSAAKVAVDAAQGKDVTVPEAEEKRRLSICEKCDIYDIARKRCRQCGCRMDMKAMLASMKCPVGKW